MNYKTIFENRRTLTIIVAPDYSITVKAPKYFSKNKIDTFVKQKISWIQKQLQSFKEQQTNRAHRFYGHNSDHFYLGNMCRLQVVQGLKAQTFYHDGSVVLMTTQAATPALIEAQLENWYLKQAEIVFRPLFTQCFSAYNDWHSMLPVLRIRKMKSRWGSISFKTMTVTLNSELIKAPKACIEYVIFHEFCHLRHKGHGKRFYELLTKVMPDWQDHERALKQMIRQGAFW